MKWRYIAFIFLSAVPLMVQRDFLTAASQGNIAKLTELANNVNVDARRRVGRLALRC